MVFGEYTAHSAPSATTTSVGRRATQRCASCVASTNTPCCQAQCPLYSVSSVIAMPCVKLPSPQALLRALKQHVSGTSCDILWRIQGAPPISTSECPPRNFVAECITRSAPSVSGCLPQGEIRNTNTKDEEGAFLLMKRSAKSRVNHHVGPSRCTEEALHMTWSYSSLAYSLLPFAAATTT